MRRLEEPCCCSSAGCTRVRGAGEGTCRKYWATASRQWGYLLGTVSSGQGYCQQTVGISIGTVSSGQGYCQQIEEISIGYCQQWARVLSADRENIYWVLSAVGKGIVSRQWEYLLVTVSKHWEYLLVTVSRQWEYLLVTVSRHWEYLLVTVSRQWEYLQDTPSR